MPKNSGEQEFYFSLKIDVTFFSPKNLTTVLEINLVLR
jgi:hypothetical protein